MRDAVRDEVEDGIRRIAAGVGANLRHGDRRWISARGIAVTANSAGGSAIWRPRRRRSAGLPVRRDLPPGMAGEDFAWFLHERPGAFVWIGNGPATAENALHNPDYNFNDAILPARAAGVPRRAWLVLCACRPSGVRR